MAELIKEITDLSALKGEEQVVIEGDVVKKYRVMEEKVDIGVWKEELEMLENMEEPDDGEVLDLAKQGLVHPYYDTYREERIKQIKDDLAKWQ